MRIVFFAMVLSAASAGAASLEKIALMDSLDMAYWCDTESKEGTLKLIDDCMRPNANVILWRDKGGGSAMRYPSKEEPAPYASEYGMEKRRNLPPLSAHWDLRLDTCFDVFGFVFDECRRRSLGYGIHHTFEENHTSNHNIAHWNLEHPEFWNCANGGMPWPGHVSLAYPEVLEHKLRFADEHLALKPQKIFLDFMRAGSWSLRYEFVKPNVDKWKKLYPGEPLPKRWQDDERWTKICSEPIMAYLREYGRRCHRQGVEFVLGLTTYTQDGSLAMNRGSCPGREEALNFIWAWKAFGIDVKQLAREGVLDGVWILDVVHDKADIWGSVRKTLAHVKECMSGKKCYLGVNWYAWGNADTLKGIRNYAKATGLTNAEVTRRLMTLATELGYDGVVYECVDCHCYDKETCEELKKW